MLKNIDKNEFDENYIKNFRKIQLLEKYLQDNNLLKKELLSHMKTSLHIKSGPSQSSIDKTFAKNAIPFNRDGTIRKLFKLLGIKHDSSVASDDLGKYGRDTSGFIAASYYLIRPTFDNWEFLGKYPLTVAWDDNQACLVVSGPVDEKIGGNVSARVAVSKYRNYYELHQLNEGHHSLTILNSISKDGILYGTMLTLGEEREAVFRPICSPVIMVITDTHTIDKPIVIDRNDERYEYYLYHLRLVSKHRYVDIVTV